MTSIKLKFWSTKVAPTSERDEGPCLTNLALNVPTVGNSSFPPFALYSVGAKKKPSYEGKEILERESFGLRRRDR